LVALPALTARARSVVNMTIAISVTGRSTGIADLHFLFLRTFQPRQPLSFNSPLIGQTALPSKLQFRKSFPRNNAALMHTEIENGVSPAVPQIPQKGTAS